MEILQVCAMAGAGLAAGLGGGRFVDRLSLPAARRTRIGKKTKWQATAFLKSKTPREMLWKRLLPQPLKER
jgi:hypothetical protein